MVNEHIETQPQDHILKDLSYYDSSNNITSIYLDTIAREVEEIDQKM